MNSHPEITINDKPSQTQLKDWYENGVVVSFTEAGGATHNGKIKSYQPMGDDALLWIENSRFDVYLRNITTYTFTPELEPVFIDANSNSPEKVGLTSEDKIFWVNKKIISQRLDYFRAMLQSGMKESSKEVVDLSQLFSAQELEVLLLVVNAGNCKTLTLEQAQIYLEAADKVSETEQAQVKINECIAFANKEFLLAVRGRDYGKCTEMLLKGANINEKFGKYAQDLQNEIFGALDLQNACTSCGPNDTPLTHAVKTGDETLVEFLLKNGAQTEVFNCGETPLMIAAFNHNSKIVQLLLEAGANPNTKKEPWFVHTQSDLTAMHNVFLSLRVQSLNTQKEQCIQVVDLLIKAGFAGNHNDIANFLKGQLYEKPICDLFTQIWQAHHNKDLENSYTQGAMIGAFCNKPAKCSAYIGTFLSRKEGGRLAQTCKPAAKIANESRENNAEAMRRKI
jgi:Ankyrin repeats (3 copies)/BTB/POZ domain